MSAHEHEMFLHALRSAGDSIEPRSDGLDQIRARLRRRPYPLPVAWLAAAWMRLTLRLPENAFSPWQLAYSARRQVGGKLRSVSERFRSVPEPASGTLRSISAWFLSELPEPAAADARAGKSSTWSLLRPLAAFGVAVFIVAVGAYVAIQVPAFVSTQTGNSQQQGHGGGGSQPGGGGVAGNSSARIPSPGSAGSPTPSRSSRTPEACITLPGPSGGASRSPSPTTSGSQSASPTPTGSGPSSSGSPTPTPSATPTPSSSSSPGGVGQPTAGESAAAGRATTDALILPAQPAVPSVRSTKSPCGTPRPRRSKKQRANGRPDATPNQGLGGVFTPAKPCQPPVERLRLRETHAAPKAPADHVRGHPAAWLRR